MILAHRTWGDPSGRVALLAHGGASSSAEWNELGLWLTERGWHVIAVDLRGHGDSPVDAATIANPSLRANVDDLTETIAAVRPDAEDIGLLLGHSWGAIVGLACTVEYPTFAKRLVLLEIGGRESSNRAQYAAEKRTKYLAAFRETQDDAVAKRNLEYALARHELFGTIDIIELAAKCVVPTLVVLGRDKDTLLGDGGSVMDDLGRYSGLIGDERRRFSAALQGAHIEIVAGGHHFYREKFPELLELLSSWLSETEPTKRPATGEGEEDMQRMYPYLLYEDLAGAPEFLERAFGFRRVEPRAVRDGHHAHSHVEMELADGSRIRMSQRGDGFRTRPAEGEGTVVVPRSTGHGSVVIQIHIDGIDAHFARAKAAGATIIRPLEESHGDRVYVADDLEGQRWHFVEGAPDEPDG